MRKPSRTHVSVVAATAAAALAGTAVAGAAGGPASSGDPTAQRTAERSDAGETPLTGTTAREVRAAALARVPGTVLRVETDRGGVDEAHVRRADGTEVEFAVGSDVRGTALREAGPGGRGFGGRGGPGGRRETDLRAVARTLGVTEARLRAAVEDARPERPSRDGARDDRGAALARALGVSTARLREALEDLRPDRLERPGRGERPDRDAFATSLARALLLDVAEVRSALEQAERAHRAEHEARETALFAAVARALGEEADDVRAAFEAARPQRPTP